MSDQTDKCLFDALTRGDQQAMSILFLRHYDFLVHYGLRMGADRALVEECVQDLFVYIFESSDRMHDVSFVKAYLFKSLRYRVLKTIKHERKINNLKEETHQRVEVEFSIEDVLIRQELKERTQRVFLVALNQLPWRQREAIYLRYYNGLNTREIAEIMGVAKQTILNTLYQALKKLRTFDDLINLRG